MSADNLTILMTSCKAYSDVLKIHDVLFQKYWPDCPFPKYLVTDEITGDSKLYDRVIEAGKEAQGSKNGLRTVMGLKKVETPYVLLLQEDFLLCDMVDTDLILHIVSLMDKYHAGNIRLIQSPAPSGVFSEEDEIMEYRAGMAYRLSMQAGLWDTKYLLDIFSRYDNGAEFERRGSFYSAEINKPVLACKYSSYPFINAIQKGMWQPTALDLLSRNHVEPDLSLHPIMTEKMALTNAIKSWVLSVNPALIVKVQNALHGGKKY